MTPMTRRLVLLLPGLGGCSVLPDRPFQETHRFALAPERPRQDRTPPRAPVLLLRGLRAAPGLDARGLRLAGPGEQVELEYWNEWIAPPPELVEEALRRWLAASGLFSAVVLPGSRLPATLVLEAELLRLQAEPATGMARATLAVLLLREGAADRPRILGQFQAEGEAPIPGGGQGRPAPADAAAAMAAALAAALTALEGKLRRVLRQSGGPAA